MSGTHKFGTALRRIARNLAWDEQGSNLVEQAIVVTMFLALIFGIIDFGRALYTYHLVSSSAREGTRYGTVRGSASALCTGTAGGCSPQGDEIGPYLQNAATGIGINPASLQVQVQYYASANMGCTANDVYNPGCIVQVRVRYPFRFMFPLLPALTYTMTSTSQMIISQ
jgi:Flp pilus assembly protein TadG